MNLKLGLLVVSVLALTACTTRLVDFTILSTKNIDLSSMATYQRGSQRVEGSDGYHIIVVIPTGLSAPNLKEAIDAAIESVPGAVGLVDGVVYRTVYWIPFIYGRDMITIEGTPLIDTKLVDAGTTNSSSNYVLRVHNEDGTVTTSNLSEDQYLEASLALQNDDPDQLSLALPEAVSGLSKSSN